jgi:hypothetical protein
MKRLILGVSIIAAAQNIPSPPANLKPPAGNTLIRTVHASGDQVYTCDGAAWTLTGPDAKLYDDHGKLVGSHFAGPTWEWAADGSRVTGRVVASITLDPDSIPWLLLTAIDHSGDGVMKDVSSVQRLNTRGGKAPSSACDAAHKGSKARAHYTADYAFFASGGQ